MDTSRRALFQSPPLDKAGPSKLFNSSSTNPQAIKRALFPTPKKEDVLMEGVKIIATEESKKRKNEDDLQGPRFKWAKSLSFDCPLELQNTTLRSWDRERHSSGNVLSQHEMSVTQGKGELSDTHRKVRYFILVFIVVPLFKILYLIFNYIYYYIEIIMGCSRSIARQRNWYGTSAV